MDHKHEPDFEQFFTRIESRVGQIWDEILSSSRLARAIAEGRITRALYAIYMIETYHYTSHNARNQVLVGVRPECSTVYT